MERLLSPSCDRNKDVILDVLREVLPTSGKVLEIGSGTGQHAAHFAANLPGLTWQPSDVDPARESIAAWALESGATNVLEPLTLDLFDAFPDIAVDAIVCINTIHIAPWAATRRLFELGAELLPSGAPLFLYGPYRYADRALEPSNQNFDAWLRARDPESGIRDFEAICDIANELGFQFVKDQPMPANNHALWWTR